MSTNPTKQADELRAAFARIDAIPAADRAALFDWVIAGGLGTAALDVLAAAADVLDFAHLLDASPVVIPRPRLAPLQIALSAYIEAVNGVADRHATP